MNPAACTLLALSFLGLCGCASTQPTIVPREITAEEHSAPAEVQSAPADSADGPLHYAIMPSDPTARAKLLESYRAAEAARAAEQVSMAQARDSDARAKSIEWMHKLDNQLYLTWLCTLEPGDPEYDNEFSAARHKYGIVPETSTPEEQRKFAVLDCSKVTPN